MITILGKFKYEPLPGNEKAIELTYGDLTVGDSFTATILTHNSVELAPILTPYADSLVTAMNWEHIVEALYKARRAAFHLEIATKRLLVSKTLSKLLFLEENDAK